MADVNFALTDPSKKGFWRRHTSTLPGGVKPVESKTGATKLVIGAQYSYGEMSAANAVEVIGNTQTHSSNQATRDLHHKDPSNPTVNFSTFMSDTNDDWNDKLDSEDLPIDKLKIQSQQKSSQPKNKEVPELFSTQSISVEKSIGIKAEIAGLVQDPMNSINSLKSSVSDANRNSRINKFKDVLQSPNVDLAALRQLSWKGIPDELRPMAWQLLLGYLPCNSDRRVATLARKRKEYEDSVSQAYARGVAGLDQTIWHQIHIDVPRTNPGIALYQYETTQQSLERILYVWAIRHPASGYVQGINDIVTPFFTVFLSAYIDGDPETYDPSLLPKEVLNVIEADSFWCLSKLLDGIQDNYTFAQPGIQSKISTLKDLIKRIDEPLATHLQEEGLEFIQFAFRWMNCLLMREMSLKNTIRMWDTYLAEDSDGFSEFHLYVCAAFLVKWSGKLKSMDFQGIMMFLQSLPTSNWNYEDIELLLSEAYYYKSLFHNAPNHLSRA
ncbi:rab-GTPase-TBC domain-containing protein [Gigaspora rosea]|uniref:Rab-GTPase-TBC domain-containing protein n=1 Tax=Gigaspora rosea TaxID=44941 RepID=A0A397TU74_9GLOM|nr:rab-GTPase-TBC domain-containing protein [Gigaspora rosea]